jgi:hypothetical protein
VELHFGDGHCFSSSWRDRGTRFKEICFLPDRWAVWPVPDVTPLQRVKVYDWCKGHQGRDYDVLGILGLPFHRHDPDKFYCSEVCLTALQAGGRATNLLAQMSPNRLYRRLAAGIRI